LQHITPTAQAAWYDISMALKDHSRLALKKGSSLHSSLTLKAGFHFAGAKHEVKLPDFFQ
jgi:hypothetical protein